MLARGTGGVADLRDAVAAYPDTSPLYGFLRFRRRSVLVRYVPPGTSRLLQARVPVHLLSITERFTPHDTVFSISTPDEVKDAALSAACSLHAASHSTSSSNSSLQRPRLGEIAEDAEESSRLSRNLSEKPLPPLPGIDRPPTAQTVRQDTVSPRTDGRSSEDTERAIRHAVQAATLAPRNQSPTRPDASDDTITRRPSTAATYHAPSSGLDPGRASTSSNRPATRDLYDGYSYALKPKVKLGPRPSVDHGRPQTSGEPRQYDIRPKASLPAGLRVAPRKATVASKPKTSTHPPLSAQNSRMYSSPPPSRDTPSPARLAPITPLSVPELKPSGGSTASIRSGSTGRAAPLSPEKQRLMKALQLRKKQLSAPPPQPAQSAPSADVKPDAPETTTMPAAQQERTIAPSEPEPNGILPSEHPIEAQDTSAPPAIAAESAPLPAPEDSQTEQSAERTAPRPVKSEVQSETSLAAAAQKESTKGPAAVLQDAPDESLGVEMRKPEQVSVSSEQLPAAPSMEKVSLTAMAAGTSTTTLRAPVKDPADAVFASEDQTVSSQSATERAVQSLSNPSFASHGLAVAGNPGAQLAGEASQEKTESSPVSAAESAGPTSTKASSLSEDTEKDGSESTERASTDHVRREDALSAKDDQEPSTCATRLSQAGPPEELTEADPTLPQRAQVTFAVTEPEVIPARLDDGDESNSDEEEADADNAEDAITTFAGPPTDVVPTTQVDEASAPVDAAASIAEHHPAAIEPVDETTTGALVEPAAAPADAPASEPAVEHAPEPRGPVTAEPAIEPSPPSKEPSEPTSAPVYFSSAPKGAHGVPLAELSDRPASPVETVHLAPSIKDKSDFMDQLDEFGSHYVDDASYADEDEEHPPAAEASMNGEVIKEQTVHVRDAGPGSTRDNPHDSTDTLSTPGGSKRASVDQVASPMRKKRRGLIDPIRTDINPDDSDDNDNLLSDESLMNELRAATVQEAKPVSVRRSPSTSVFPRRPGDAWMTHRAASNPSVPVLAQTRNGSARLDPQSELRARSVSGPFGGSNGPKPGPIAMIKKINVSSGISQRIKALELLSSQTGSPVTPPLSSTTSSPNASPSHASRRPSSSRAGTPKSIVVPAQKSVSPLPASLQAQTEDARRRIPRPESPREPNTESVSVKARIVKDSGNMHARKGESTPDSGGPTTPLDLHESPLFIEHHRPSSASRSRGSRLMSPKERPLSVMSSSFIPRSDPGSPTSTSTTRRPSVTSRNSTSSLGRGESDSRKSSSSTGADEKREKKESTKSRIFRRMSSISGASRKSLVHAVSPTLREEESVVETAALLEPRRGSIDVGEVNVQFPDSLVGVLGGDGLLTQLTFEALETQVPQGRLGWLHPPDTIQDGRGTRRRNIVLSDADSTVCEGHTQAIPRFGV